VIEMSLKDGSEEHQRLVRLALLKAISEMELGKLKVINLGLPIGDIHASIDISSLVSDRWRVTEYGGKRFEPDIACIVDEGTVKEERLGGRTEDIRKMGLVLIEAETGKRNLLADTYRKTAYKLLKLQQNRFYPIRLILAVWDDLDLKGTPEPFDEVWRFKQ